MTSLKDMELLLLKETNKKPTRGIISSLLGIISSDILNPLIKTAYDSISDPVIVVLISTCSIVFCNKSACSLYYQSSHYDISSLTGKNISLLLPQYTKNIINNTTELIMTFSDHNNLIFPVSVSCGRLAKEGIISDKVPPKDILVLTIQKKISRSDSNASSISRYKLEFEEIKKIGKGAFGTVVQARNKLDGQEYAIKKVHLNCSPENLNISTNSSNSSWSRGHSRKISESDHRLLNEVKTFALLSNHPNVIRYYNAWIEPVEESQSTDVDDDLVSDSSISSAQELEKNHHSTLFIQMQLCSYQDLRLWIKSRTSISEQVCLSIFSQIVSGLAHIHSQEVIHRDIKPENIFLHQENVFLGDFGLAKNISDHALSHSNAQKSSTTFAAHVPLQSSTDDGTFFYMSPELISSQTCTTKSDMYSLGIILFELFSIFETDMERIITLNALKTQGKVPDIFINLLSDDPKERPSANEILHSGLYIETSPQKRTPSSFGGSFSDFGSPMTETQASEFDNSAGLKLRLRRQSGGENIKERQSISLLRNSQSSMSLRATSSVSSARQRRPTDEFGWNPWEQFLQEEVVEGLGFEDVAVAIAVDKQPSQSYVEPGFLHKNTNLQKDEMDPKDRIKALERDVAMLEAKLKKMTVKSLELETKLEEKNEESLSIERSSSIPIPTKPEE